MVNAPVRRRGAVGGPPFDLVPEPGPAGGPGYSPGIAKRSGVLPRQMVTKSSKTRYKNRVLPPQGKIANFGFGAVTIPNFYFGGTGIIVGLGWASDTNDRQGVPLVRGSVSSTPARRNLGRMVDCTA
jgi:hypothetical protein